MKRDGLTLYYQDLGERDAPALVLVHGLGCDSTIWREQLTDFSRDHRVLAVDLPGFGQSDKPHDRDYSLAWFAQTLQWVLEDAKVERPVLVGHSMGFAIVRRHCLDYPGVAAALCDVDGFCFRNPMQAQLYTVWKQIVDFIQWPFVTPEERRIASWAQFIEYTFYGKTFGKKFAVGWSRPTCMFCNPAGRTCSPHGSGFRRVLKSRRLSCMRKVCIRFPMRKRGFARFSRAWSTGNGMTPATT